MECEQSTNNPSFLDVEREIQCLLIEHQRFIKLLDGNLINPELRLEYTSQARSLLSDVQKLVKYQKKIAIEEFNAETAEKSFSVNDNSPTPEKLSFLNILKLEPRKSDSDEPANRKSRRNRIPATKLILGYGSGSSTESKSPRKRLIRKKPLEIDRPSSTPSSATCSTAVLPSRFITESTVDCDLCKRPFKVHRVSSPLDQMPSKNVCFGCQMNADQLIYEESVSQNVGLRPIASSVVSALKMADSADTFSRSSSPGFRCD